MVETSRISGDILKSYIEKLESLEAEKKAVSEGITEVYTEAKSAGFDIKTMKQLIKIRRMNQNDVEEQEILLDTYKSAIGMV